MSPGPSGSTLTDENPIHGDVNNPPKQSNLSNRDVRLSKTNVPAHGSALSVEGTKNLIKAFGLT